MVNRSLRNCQCNRCALSFLQVSFKFATPCLRVPMKTKQMSTVATLLYWFLSCWCLVKSTLSCSQMSPCSLLYVFVRLVPRAFSTFKMAGRRRNRWTRLLKYFTNPGAFYRVKHNEMSLFRLNNGLRLPVNKHGCQSLKRTSENAILDTCYKSTFAFLVEFIIQAIHTSDIYKRFRLGI